MTAPFESVPGVVQLLIGLGSTVLMVIGMRAASKPARIMRVGGCSVIQFELAGDAGRLRTILDRWGDVGRDAASVSLAVDTAFFIPGYSVTTAVIASGIAAEMTYRVSELAGNLTRVAAWVALAAGVLDIIENIALWRVLGNHVGAGKVASFVARVKFLAIGVAVAWLLLLALPTVATPGL